MAKIPWFEWGGEGVHPLWLLHFWPLNPAVVFIKHRHFLTVQLMNLWPGVCSSIQYIHCRLDAAWLLWGLVTIPISSSKLILLPVKSLILILEWVDGYARKRWKAHRNSLVPQQFWTICGYCSQNWYNSTNWESLLWIRSYPSSMIKLYAIRKGGGF